MAVATPVADRIVTIVKMDSKTAEYAPWGEVLLRAGAVKLDVPGGKLPAFLNKIGYKGKPVTPADGAVYLDALLNYCHGTMYWAHAGKLNSQASTKDFDPDKHPRDSHGRFSDGDAVDTGVSALVAQPLPGGGYDEQALVAEWQWNGQDMRSIQKVSRDILDNKPVDKASGDSQKAQQLLDGVRAGHIFSQLYRGVAVTPAVASALEQRGAVLTVPLSSASKDTYIANLAADSEQDVHPEKSVPVLFNFENARGYDLAKLGDPDVEDTLKEVIVAGSFRIADVGTSRVAYPDSGDHVHGGRTITTVTLRPVGGQL